MDPAGKDRRPWYRMPSRRCSIYRFWEPAGNKSKKTGKSNVLGDRLEYVWHLGKH